jgi:hypothetical protein
LDGSLHYAAPALFGSLFLLGVITVLYSEREKGILIVGPIVLALAASASGAYPVGTRVSLFLVPLVLLTVVHGIDAASRMVLRQRIGAFGCLLLLPLATQSLLEQLPPRRPEHLRPVLQYVAERWRQGDALWVYYGAGQVFEYYRRLIPISGAVQLGDCNREDPREYLRQVDVERGRSRVWMLFAHGSGPFRFDERRLLLAYLDTIGKRLDAFRAPPEDTSALVAAVFLYDLSNDQKLASARAATFPITEKYTPTRWTCYGVQSPIPERNGAATHAVMLLGSQ